MKRNELISPFMQGAFSEPVLHKLVLSKIDFELSDEIWCYINEGFGHFWDVEVGVGNDFYFDEACQSIQKHLDSVGVLFPSEKLATILDIMFDFIEQIPGAFLDDDAVLVPENKNINEFCGCYSDFESSETLPAITDNDTNIVFISKWLKDELPSFFDRFTTLMDEMGIQWCLLKATCDIWARDYMPVQLSEKEFVKYKYSPNYLHGDKEHTTDCEEACKALGINYRETDLIIDGGNITPCGDYFVMTSKVFTENGKLKGDWRFKLLLEKELGRNVIIIPWHQIGSSDDPKTDVYGHSDGFVKWCGGNKVLMSNHRDTDAKEAAAIRRILESYGFEVTEMLFDVENPNPDWNWAYINFLQVGNKIIMPSLGIAEDRQALEYVKNAFPDCDVRQIRMRDIAEKGGALHCITWNIKFGKRKTEIRHSGLNYDELKPLAEQGDAEAQLKLAQCYDEGRTIEKDYTKVVEWCTKAAEQGYAGAQNNLGTCYYRGEGVEKDYAKAVEWYAKAAEQGESGAQYNLGACYYKGCGVEKDYAKALKLFRKAAEQADSLALNDIGICYENGYGVEKDINKAVECYARAAEQGCATAQNNLGLCYIFGQGVETDYKKAVEWFTKAAEQNDGWGQYNLAVSYEKGEGVEKNYVKAVEWFTKAAMQGLADAQNTLGGYYKRGDGVEKDIAKAVEWYTKAAQQGNAKAQYNLAKLYKEGQGVESDDIKAAKWFTKAAKQGCAEAQNSLAICYELGEGVEKDRRKAVEWFIKAAEQGNKNARYNLTVCCDGGFDIGADITKVLEWFTKMAAQGDLEAMKILGVAYKYGEGVKKDLAKAVEWLTKAAEQGYAPAQNALGFCYEYGDGVEKDLKKAIEWYTKAAEQGDARAQNNLALSLKELEGKK